MPPKRITPIFMGAIPAVAKQSPLGGSLISKQQRAIDAIADRLAEKEIAENPKSKKKMEKALKDAEFMEISASDKKYADEEFAKLKKNEEEWNRLQEEEDKEKGNKRKKAAQARKKEGPLPLIKKNWVKCAQNNGMEAAIGPFGGAYLVRNGRKVYLPSCK